MSVFSDISIAEKLFQSENFFIIFDRYPISPGHLLIISNKNHTDFFDLDENEKQELINLIDKAREIIEEKYQPDGYNIGMNCGVAAGQTVMHFHCHVIPRYSGDTNDPSGGIRHCIPGKGYY